VDFPGIGIIDLDATELLSNDREILEAATERMFADSSVLDANTSVLPMLRQDEGDGGLVPPVAPKEAEGVLGEPTAGTESVVIEPPPMPAGESTDAPLLEPVEAVVDAPTPSVVSAAEGAIAGAGPSSSQLVAAAVEEVPVLSQAAVVPQERDAPEATTRAASPQERNAPEGTTRAASPEIQEAGEDSGAALPRGIGGDEAQALELARAPWAAAFEVCDDVEDDEEDAAYNTLEHGLAWVRCAFDELILPATSVSFPCASSWFSNFLGSSERCGSPSTCSGQSLAAFGRRRVRTTRELRAEQA
jgi:hypothetical protein